MKAFNFLFLFSLVFSNLVLAEEWVIRIDPTQKNAASDCKNISGEMSKIQGLTEVFTSYEKKVLQKLQKGVLSCAWKGSFTDQEIQGLKQKLLFNAKFTFEKQSLVEVQELGEIHPDQWALKNRGQKVALVYDDQNTYFREGKMGEDVGVDFQVPTPLQTKKVTVAVLDTGLDYTHPSFPGEVLATDSKECKVLAEFDACEKKAKDEKEKKVCRDQFAKRDENGNGYPLDCIGYNVVKNNYSTLDTLGHGTHVSGIMAAKSSTTPFVSGMAPEAIKILPVTVIASAMDVPGAPVRPRQSGKNDAASFPDLVARGMLYAIASQAQVIHMSLGWPSQLRSSLFEDVLEIAKEKKILVVASAGNDSSDYPIYPCILDGVVCVGSHTHDGGLSHFSNYGSSVDLQAPGSRILSTWPLSLRPSLFTDVYGYEYKDGTSQSAPYVSGALAKLLSVGFSPEESLARIYLGTREPSYQNSLGFQLQKRVYTQGGNLDVKGAFDIKPQSFVRPKKNPGLRFVVWSPKEKEVLLPIQFENLWKDQTESTKVKISFFDSRVSEDVQLEKENFYLDPLKSKEISEIQVPLRILKDNPISQIVLTIQVSSGEKVKTYHQEFEVLRLYSDLTSDEIKMSFKIPENYESWDWNTLESSSSKSLLPSYLISKSSRTEFQYLFALSGQEIVELTWSSQKKIDFSQGFAFIGSYKIDADFEGKEEIALAFLLMPKERGKQPEFNLKFFDQEGNLKSELKTSQDRAKIKNDFKWMKLGSQLVPSWIQKGDIPELEEKKTGPWKKVTVPAKYRVYYLSPEGLRSVSLGEDDLPVQILECPECSPGELSVLVTSLSYDFGKEKVVKIRDGKVQEENALFQKKYRFFGGLSSRVWEKMGNFFFGESKKGVQRVQFIKNHEVVLDEELRSRNELDSIRTFAASEGMEGLFAFTNYNIEYFNLETMKSDGLSLRKFSFLPQYVFDTGFIPFKVRDEHGEFKQGLYFPPGLGSSPSIDFITHQKDSNGNPWIIRPLKQRIVINEEGCELQNPWQSEITKGQSWFVVRCKNRLELISP